MNDLDELERLLAAATPGPWEVVQYGGVHTVGDSRDNPPVAASYDRQRESNEALIVAAVNALPELIVAARDLNVERLARAFEAVTGEDADGSVRWWPERTLEGGQGTQRDFAAAIAAKYAELASEVDAGSA